MACALGFQVKLIALGNGAAQPVRCLGLACAGDIVQFAFDCEQRGVLDVLRAHTLQIAFGGAHIPGAVDQAIFLEHGTDGFQIVVRVHVQDGVVLVVELAVRFGAGVVALDQVLEVVVMADHVAVRVHGDKAGVLQKAGVHTATCAGEAVGHRVDDVVLKPLVTALGGQVVHCGGGAARVNRASHHGHGQGCLLAPAGHERYRRQHWHRGLTHAYHMTVAILGLQVADELLHVVHVVVEVELALGQGHQTGVLPVGDIDLVVLQHGAHRIAQQRGVVARQGGHDQHHRLVLEFGQGGRVIGEALEAAQLAKRLVQVDTLVDSDFHAVHVDGLDIKRWLFVVFTQAVKQVVSR